MRPSILLLATTALLSAPIAHADDVRKIPAQGIRALVIDNAQGKVSIDGRSESNDFEISISAIDDPANCEVKTETSKGELTVTAGSREKLTFRDKCRIDIAVKAPRQVSLDVRLGTGSLAANALSGNVRFNVGSGNTVMTGIQGSELTGRTGSGDVNVSGVVAEADLKVGAGNVQVTYDKAAAELAAGSLNVKVGSGNTTVFVPENTRVVSRFRSGTGSLTNEFPHSDSAKIKISGSSGTGDMFIRKI